MRRNAWWPALGFTLFLWGSVPYVRPVSEWFRAHGFLSPAIHLLTGILLIAFFWVWRVIYRTWTPQRFVFLGGVLCLYGIGMRYYVVAPEERIHFLEISFLTFLFHRALRSQGESRRWQALGAMLWGAGAGIIEEAIQLKVPGRQFDWRDVGMNVTSAVLAGLTIYAVLLPRRSDKLTP